jgi:hypothetical protein
MTEPGFEDFEGLTFEQRRQKLRQIQQEHEESLEKSGVIRIKSPHLPNRLWEVDSQDVLHVTEDTEYRPGGFRETIYLLLRAGF